MHQLLVHIKYLYRKENGLFYHGFSFLRNDNFGGIHWCRGNSWFTLGLPLLLEQAEETDGDRPVRRLWGTRLKKFGDRWMANRMEVETVGSGHRTKITVEELR